MNGEKCLLLDLFSMFRCGYLCNTLLWLILLSHVSLKIDSISVYFRTTVMVLIYINDEPKQFRKLYCPSPFSDIPEDIFFKICSYLSAKEVWRLGSVCSRWHRMTRSGILWERTDLVSLNLPPKKSQQFLLKLPSCVKELRIGCQSGSDFQSLNVPRLYHTLLERFPDLNVLIIENAILENPFVQFSAVNGFVYNGLLSIQQQVRKYFSVVNYYKTDVDADFNTLVNLLRHVTVLSLRNSILAVEFRIDDIRLTSSRIKVFDLTKCPCVIDQTIRQFVQLPVLQELYLAGTAISVNGVEIILTEVPNLKVLDLDDTVIGSETFAILRDHGQKLVKLYLGKTAVRDSDLIDVDEETFPVLKKICLQRTAVSEIGVKKLLLSVHSLTHIFLTKSRVKISWMLDQPLYMRMKLKYDDYDESEECNHFLKNKFGGDFSYRCII